MTRICLLQRPLASIDWRPSQVQEHPHRWSRRKSDRLPRRKAFFTSIAHSRSNTGWPIGQFIFLSFFIQLLFFLLHLNSIEEEASRCFIEEGRRDMLIFDGPNDRTMFHFVPEEPTVSGLIELSLFSRTRAPWRCHHCPQWQSVWPMPTSSGRIRQFPYRVSQRHVDLVQSITTSEDQSIRWQIESFDERKGFSPQNSFTFGRAPVQIHNWPYWISLWSAQKRI